MDESGNTTHCWLQERQTLDVRFPPKAEGNSSSHIGRPERGVSKPAFPSGYGLPVPRAGSPPVTVAAHGPLHAWVVTTDGHRSAQPIGCAAVYLKRYLFSCSDVSFQFFPYNIQSSEVAEVRACSPELRSANTELFQQPRKFYSSEKSQ